MVEPHIAYFRRVVHDVANSANAVSMHLELIEALAAAGQNIEAPLARAHQDIERVMSTLKRSMYLPPMSLSAERVTIRLREMVDAVWESLGPPTVDLENSLPVDVSWHVSESFLFQALAAVMDNAARSAEQVMVSGDDRHILVCNAVADDNDASQWRQPLHTSRGPGHLGLGLNVAQDAMTALGGSLDLVVGDGICRVRLQV